MGHNRFEGRTIVSDPSDWKEIEKILNTNHARGGRMTARDKVQRAEQEMRRAGRQVLEDTVLAQNAKEKALEGVKIGASSSALAALSNCLNSCINSGVAFTTDDIWFNMMHQRDEHGAGVTVREPRVLGALMKDASDANRIVPTGEWRTSTRVACHQRPVRIWRKK